MAQPKRVALMFDLDGADQQTRQLVGGIHRYAQPEPSRAGPPVTP